MYEALFSTYVSFISVGVDDNITRVSAKGFLLDASSLKRYRQRMRLTNENPRPSIPRQVRHDRHIQTSFTDHERRARDAFEQHPSGPELPTVSFEICFVWGPVPFNFFMFQFFTLWLEFNDRSIFVNIDIGTERCLYIRHVVCNCTRYVSQFHHVGPVHERPASPLL